MARRQTPATPEPAPPPQPPSPYKALLPSPTQTFLEMQVAAKELSIRATVEAAKLEDAKAAVSACAFERWKLGAIETVVTAIRAGKLGPVLSFSVERSEGEDFNFDEEPWEVFLDTLVRELGEAGWLVSWERRRPNHHGGEYPTVLVNGVKPDRNPTKP